MTALLENLDIRQPSPDDLVAVLLRHPDTCGLGWAVVHDRKVLTWDGWYADNPKLRTLGDLNSARTDIAKVAATQLGPALLASELLSGHLSILSSVRFHLMNNPDSAPVGGELAVLRAAGVVAYMAIGPADDLLPYLYRTPGLPATATAGC